MNKFFPLPILTALLGVFLTLAYFTSAYAQQHDSPASAQKLDADHPISLTLPAYATEYFYFSLPNSGDSVPTIILSDSSEIDIQLYDSREVSLKYAISSSHVITFHDSLSSGERYFLKLDSLSFQDKKLKLTLRYTEKAKGTSDTKEVVKSKNSDKATKTKNTKKSVKQKTSVKSKTRTKAKASGNSKTAKKSETSTNSKTATKSKNSVTPKTSTISVASPEPIASTKAKNSVADAAHTQNPIMTPAPTPKKSAKPTITNPNSKSNFLLSTHFLRTKAGTSLAIAEALNISEESSSLSYRCIFSDRISIQNGILYSRSPGIAVIEIVGNNFKSSCTICIQ